MKNIRDPKKVLSAESIAKLADHGENVSRFFTNAGRMMPPIQRVNVDFTAPMLSELDDAAKELNISRQAVIKTLLRQALDQRYLARNVAPRSRRA
jgi:hypothetical protein